MSQRQSQRRFNFHRGFILTSACVLGLIAGAATPASAVQFETQTFDSAASAGASGWGEYRSRPGQGTHNYGFSATNNTGFNPAGEAGGIFNRPSTDSYYADQNLGGTFTLNDRVEASGEFIVTVNPQDTGVLIGHFDQVDVRDPGQTNRSALGLSVVEQSGTQVRVRPMIVDDGSTAVGSIFHRMTNRDGGGNPIPMSFQYIYDPSLGANGRITLAFTDLNTNTPVTLFDPLNNPVTIISYDLTASERAFPVFLNAFGLTSSDIAGTSTPGITAFIDNVTYTAPEPAALTTMAGIAGAVLLRRRRGSRSVKRT